MIVRAADTTKNWRFMMDSDARKAGEVEGITLMSRTSTGMRRFDVFLYKLPTGASAITIGSVSGGVYTPSKEGRLIRWDGALASGGDAAGDIAGMLLTDYFDGQPPDLPVGHAEFENSTRVTVLSPGDFFFIVREGQVELAATAAVTNRYPLIANGTATGQVVEGDPTDMAEMVQGIDLHTCVGHALEAIGAAGLVEAYLRLPPMPTLTF